MFVIGNDPVELVGVLKSTADFNHISAELHWDPVVPSDIHTVIVVLCGGERRVTVRVTKLLPDVRFGRTSLAFFRL